MPVRRIELICSPLTHHAFVSNKYLVLSFSCTSVLRCHVSYSTRIVNDGTKDDGVYIYITGTIDMRIEKCVRSLHQALHNQFEFFISLKLQQFAVERQQNQSKQKNMQRNTI